MKRLTVVRWWPHDAPIPAGWQRIAQRSSHHSLYGFLIKRARRRTVTEFLADEMARVCDWLRGKQ